MFQLLFLKLNCTAQENIRITKAKNSLVQIFNSPEFALWLAKQNFTQTKKQPELKDFLKSVVINYSVINRPWYKRFSSVVGYAEGNSIYTYRNVFSAMSEAELIGHLAHEICHVLGFSHSFRDNPERPYSIPYAVGSYIERVLK